MKPSTSNIRRSERLFLKEQRRPTKTTSNQTSQRSTVKADNKNNSDRSESPVAGNILNELERRIGKDGYYYECLLCEDGGRLICCENCPGTYHRKCLGLRYIPEGDWLCPTCSDNAAAGSSKERFLKDLGTEKPLSFKKKKAAASSPSPSSKSEE